MYDDQALGPEPAHQPRAVAVNVIGSRILLLAFFGLGPGNHVAANRLGKARRRHHGLSIERQARGNGVANDDIIHVAVLARARFRDPAPGVAVPFLDQNVLDGMRGLGTGGAGSRW